MLKFLRQMLTKAKNLNKKAIFYGVLSYLAVYLLVILTVPILNIVWPGTLERFINVNTFPDGIQLSMYFSWLVSGFLTGMLAKRHGLIHGSIVGCLGTVIMNMALNFFSSIYTALFLISPVVCGLSGVAGRFFSSRWKGGRAAD